eukprot:5181522-Pleurochrysis_carterae.AAC.1
MASKTGNAYAIRKADNMRAKDRPSTVITEHCATVCRKSVLGVAWDGSCSMFQHAEGALPARRAWQHVRTQSTISSLVPFTTFSVQHNTTQGLGILKWDMMRAGSAEEFA